VKGRNPTVAQKAFWDLLVREIGCAASWKDGFHEPVCSIHHIDGRTKPNAHWLVLPLSAGNHQDGTGAPGRIAVHPYKARFEAQYGRQVDLLRACLEELRRRGCAVPADALLAVGATP
jgi:Recombination enhancement, RecA-dependent nuclease